MPSLERRSFHIVIASTGRRIEVPARRSALGVLEEHGFRIPNSCRVGICGMCRTGVLKGEPEHWDGMLSECDRESGAVFMPCCSRAVSEDLVLDL